RISVSQVAVGAVWPRLWKRLLWYPSTPVPSGAKLSVMWSALGQAKPKVANRLRSSKVSRVNRVRDFMICTLFRFNCLLSQTYCPPGRQAAILPANFPRFRQDLRGRGVALAHRYSWGGIRLPSIHDTLDGRHLLDLRGHLAQRMEVGPAS